MDGAHKRTIQRALQIVVSKERLAAALHVSMQDLEAYLVGERRLPDKAFVAALDIVAERRQED